MVLKAQDCTRGSLTFAYLHCLVPTWLLHLVVNDRLVLGDAVVAGSRKYRFLWKVKEGG